MHTQRLRGKQQEHKERQYHLARESRLAHSRGDRALADKLRERVCLCSCLLPPGSQLSQGCRGQDPDGHVSLLLVGAAAAAAAAAAACLEGHGCRALRKPGAGMGTAPW